MSGFPVISPIMAKLFGTRNERFVKKFTSRVEQINASGKELVGLSDEELRAKTAEFRKQYAEGATESDLLIPSFAVAREVMDRAVGIRNIFDPERSFDSSLLPSDVKRLYDETKAKIESTPDADPVGDLIGSVEPVPAWKLVPIPVVIYQAVRDIYKESKPPFRARPFDVQLIGGMVLAEHKYSATRTAAQGRPVYFGAIAEMKTGEGKTIVAPLACYLHAIVGRQIHVVTVNSYLVKRDRDWTFPFFYHMGLTVGHIAPYHELPEELKKVSYQCDVVYGTTSEFGFDFLRDNMKLRVEDQVQKHRDFAIVDEVDSTLIDEARTPLIISGPAHDDLPRYQLANDLAAHLAKMQKPWDIANQEVDSCKMRIKGLEGDIRNTRDKEKIPAMKEELTRLNEELPRLEDARDRHIKYYEVEMDKKSLHIEHEGISEAQKKAGIGSFYVGDNIDLPHLLEQSLRAHTVYERDKDYVVSDGQVVIVDQFTGRLMVGRQWSDGLHQAVEAKEGVEIKPETQTMATITIQNFYKLYERLSGMTGTADTEAQEFHDIYNMDVVVIPTNVPVIRRDYNDRIYLTQKDKWKAIVDEIKTFHDTGRPVLVGTTSVEHSEMLSRQLKTTYGIEHQVLNAKQHEHEAHIIENAGSLGAVMIATNMAGRGTDIVLRPVEREALIGHWQRRGMAPKNMSADLSDEEILNKVHRHLAEKTLGMKRAEIEALDDEAVMRKLLITWAKDFTFLEEDKLAKMSLEDIRKALDEGGDFLLHRLALWNTTEEIGGLHVIGTERHESRRIDNQLRGRSGRQGDRGSSRFFIALDDDLMKMFAGETTNRILSRLGMKEGDSIEHPMLSKAVERAQRKVEERNFEIRKNILEYDEVMDYQRNDFYDRRQSILEGKGLRDIVMEYIGEAVADACDRFLSDDFVPTCMAEWIQNNLDVSIEPNRLAIDDRDDLLKRVRLDAYEDARLSIEVTIGEFMSPEVDPVDWDTNGLILWAKTRFGVPLSASEVRTMTTKEVRIRLQDAAHAKIDEADMSGLDQYMIENYQEKQLVDWVCSKFPITLTAEEIKGKEIDEVEELLMQRVQEAYHNREIAYPVDYVMEGYMSLMAQDPSAAMLHLGKWAKFKYGLDWGPQYILTKTPQQHHATLVEESRKWHNGRLEEVVTETFEKYPDDESLNQYFRERLMMALQEKDRGLTGEARKQMIRDKWELFMRMELTGLERYILLQILDQSWKDHLYSMDLLRSSVSFRSFAQLDPRMEYRREGRILYDQMVESIRDKITNMIFKAKVQQNLSSQQVRRMMQNQQMRAQAQGAAGEEDSSSGTATATATSTATATATLEADEMEMGTARQRADLEIAKQAGSAGEGAETKAKTRSQDRAAKLREARKHNKRKSKKRNRS